MLAIVFERPQRPLHDLRMVCRLGAQQRVLHHLVCPPELKVRTPAHTKHPGWHLESESRVTQGNMPRPRPADRAYWS